MNRNANWNRKNANKEEVILFCLIGEAVCRIQLMEDALSYSNTFKKYSDPKENKTKSEVNLILKAHQSDTLGKSVKFAKKHCLYNRHLQTRLENFNTERNWIIHRSLPENYDTFVSEGSNSDFIARIKNISDEARNLQLLLEEDMMTLAEERGANISDIRQKRNSYYSN